MKSEIERKPNITKDISLREELFHFLCSFTKNSFAYVFFGEDKP